MATVSLTTANSPTDSTTSSESMGSSFRPTTPLVSKQGLEVTETTRSVRVETDRPHLVSLGGGRLSTAVTIHPLQEGRTNIGSSEASIRQDIIIEGTGIEPEHCYLDNNDSIVIICPLAPSVALDGMRITAPTRLSQGSMICLGRSTFFRFNHPQEAKMIKQILPGARISIAPAGFLSALADETLIEDHQESVPLESSDFVEKVSKFEYLAHSRSPPMTSQETPKWFMNEGIRIPTSPSSSSGASWSPNGNDDVFSNRTQQFYQPSPNLERRTKSLGSDRSPITQRIKRIQGMQQSRTPEPQMVPRSPVHFWSGRCTPTSPHLHGSSLCNSEENIRACEDDLKKRHRKARLERLRDEEQERLEKQRLEEIINMCAEYERQSQKSKPPHHQHHAPKLRNHQPIFAEPPSSYSHFPLNATNTPTMVNHSPQTSPIHRPTTQDNQRINSNGIPTSNNPAMVPGNYGSSNTLPHYSSITHNRIKTNGSLPRDRVPQTLPGGTFTDNVDGATLIINPKALLQPEASSEDELNEILGEQRRNVLRKDEDRSLLTSPHLGTGSLNQHPQQHSSGVVSSGAATTTKGAEGLVLKGHQNNNNHGTVAAAANNHQRMVPGGAAVEINNSSAGFRVYENQHATDFTRRQIVVTADIELAPKELRKEIWAKQNSREGTPEKTKLLTPEKHEELRQLCRWKIECVRKLSAIKQAIGNIEAQESEQLRELEMELALVAGEEKEEQTLLLSDLNELAKVQEDEKKLTEQAEKEKKEEQDQLESAKQQLREREETVNKAKGIIESLKTKGEGVNDEVVIESLSQEDNMAAALQEQEDGYKRELELMEAEKKAFEDLEFQQLESQAHREEEREALTIVITEIPDVIQERKDRLVELIEQQKSLSEQVEQEQRAFHTKKQHLTKSLYELQMRLDSLELMIRQRTHSTETRLDSSPDSSPRSFRTKLLTHITENGNTNEWRETRDEGCQSYHSMDSETSSALSTDVPGDSSSNDRSRPTSLQKDGSNSAASKDSRPISTPNSDEAFFEVRNRDNLLSLQDDLSLIDNTHNTSPANPEVTRRPDKQKAQRPLTRYLPIRSQEFDLRQHVETAGHQIELCHFVRIDATSCRGYLQKLGGKWHTWKKRWFVFDRIKRALVYFSDKSENKLRGAISFQAIEEVYVDHLHSVKSPHPQATLCMKTYDRVYYLMAPSPEAMRIWVDVIFTGAEGYLEFLAEGDQ